MIQGTRIPGTLVMALTERMFEGVRPSTSTSPYSSAKSHVNRIFPLLRKRFGSLARATMQRPGKAVDSPEPNGSSFYVAAEAYLLGKSPRLPPSILRLTALCLYLCLQECLSLPANTSLRSTRAACVITTDHAETSTPSHRPNTHKGRHEHLPCRNLSFIPLISCPPSIFVIISSVLTGPGIRETIATPALRSSVPQSAAIRSIAALPTP